MNEKLKIAIAFFLCGLAASVFVSTISYKMGFDAGAKIAEEYYQNQPPYDFGSFEWQNITIVNNSTEDNATNIRPYP